MKTNMNLNCLHAYNAAICLRKAIGTVVENPKNLLKLPLDKYYVAFCENYKIIDKTALCLSCEGCLDFEFLTKIWFEYIGKLEEICNSETDFINNLSEKFLVPNGVWDKYCFIMSLYEQKDFILKNYSDVNKETLEKISDSVKTAYLNLCQTFYSNLIADCNDKVLSLFTVLNKRKLDYSDVDVAGLITVYFDTNVFSDYVNNKSFYSLVNLSKTNGYTYVYSPYILEDGIKSDRIHFLYDCNKLLELTDNKTILPIDDTFLIKKEDVFDCAKRVHLFRDYTQAQEEKNVYKKKFYELSFLTMPNKKQNFEKLNRNFFSFFQNDVSKNDELKDYMEYILYYADNSLNLSDIINGSINYENLQKVVDGLFQFFDYIGYACDKDKKTLKSSIQDLEHVKSAIASDIFVTSDEKLYKRATVIYTLLGIKTKVMKKDDFKQSLTLNKGSKMMQVPFLSLKDITAKYADELHEAVFRVTDSGWYLQGNENKKFEEDYARYIGTKYCVGVANGLQALELMIRACKILYGWNDGDEIIVQANTYIATILAISQNNLKPILLDPNAETLELDADSIEKAITPKTRAVMLVHLYGRCLYNEKIDEICKNHGLKLFEDNAQAHGCMYKGKKTGSFGTVAAHSFYPGKNLGAFGDAGAITTDDKEIADLVRVLGNYGSSKKYVFDYVGENSRLDEMAAAVLDVKLKHLDDDNNIRKQIAKMYYEGIKNPLIKWPAIKSDESNVFHIFPVFCEKRDELQQYLKEHEIETLIHYPIAPHKQKCYKDWNDINLPVTEKIHAEELSLPMSPCLTDEQIRYVINAINNY